MWTFIQKLQQDPSTSNTFSWKIDSLWYKYRLYHFKNSKLKKKKKIGIAHLSHRRTLSNFKNLPQGEEIIFLGWP